MISIISQQVLPFKTCQILFTLPCFVDIFLSRKDFFVPWLAGVILFSCLVGDCVILSEATRVYRQLEVILAWKYCESVLVEFSRYYLTLCSCVVDTGVSWPLESAAKMDSDRAFHEKTDHRSVCPAYGDWHKQ